MRSKLCRRCFSEKAVASGAESVGNAEAQGKLGNRGNTEAQGKLGNRGNTQARGNPQNAGNEKKGIVKKRAGKRSGLKRCTKDLLLIKSPWLQLILRKRKTWEIRGSSTHKRGLIHLGLSGSGGEIHGRARVTDCRLLTREELRKHKDKHCIEDVDSVRYAKIYAWVFSDVLRYKKPLQHSHKQGAIIWCKL